MQNAIPVFTFLIAVICRIEVIRLSKIDGVAKLVGIVSCVTGAVTMSLYKGPVVLGSEPSPADGNVHISDHGWLTSSLQTYGLDLWHIGSVCLVLNCFCMGIYTNLQIPTFKRFPAPVSITAGSIFVGTVALVITSLLTVSDASQWALNRPGNIVSVLYAGFVASGVNFTLQTWANQRGGPILVAVYIPLQTVFSVFLGLVILDDPLYLGSLIGALFILAGLYLVIWGQQAHQRADKRAAVVSSLLAEDVERPLLS
jgi:drug/metabolite transporter (DMT)-like permease